PRCGDVAHRALHARGARGDRAGGVAGAAAAPRGVPAQAAQRGALPVAEALVTAPPALRVPPRRPDRGERAGDPARRARDAAVRHVARRPYPRGGTRPLAPRGEAARSLT